MTSGSPATEMRSVPWVGMAALVAATASGVLFFLIGGAPGAYTALNGLALLLGLAIVALAPGRMSGRTAACIMAFGVAGIAATLMTGFDIEGVRRWLPVGPVCLHAAMLLLPAIAVLMPSLSRRMQVASIIVLAAVFAIQPDVAAVLSLAAGFMSSRPGRSDLLVTGIGAAAAIAATAVALLRSHPLAAVDFVEHVVPDAFAINAVLGLLIGGALLFACAAPLFVRAGNPRAKRAFAAVMAGFVFASLIGAYPVPLVGYGASSILGYAMGLALLRAAIVPSEAG